MDRLTSVEGVTGAEEIIYSQEFDYDSIGNMMQLSNYIVPPVQPTPTVTPTSAPTDTPTPGDTPTPSDTPEPSDTPIPSDTPTASSTPTQAPPTIDTYAYDPNGNMIERNEAGVEWMQGFNAENRLASLSSTAGDWEFTYDGDGNRVKQVHDGVTTLYLTGGSYEVRDATGEEEIFKYYSVAGQRVAMLSEGQVKYLLTDHLGSVVGVLTGSGTLLSEQRYLPFGEARFEIGVTETDFGFTGQRALAGTGLMDYNARFYDARLGKFTQPDSIVPNYSNPQNLNRFAYVANNPLNLIDPSGNVYCHPDRPCAPKPPDPPPICYYCRWTPPTPPPGSGEPGDGDPGDGGDDGDDHDDREDDEGEQICLPNSNAGQCVIDRLKAGSDYLSLGVFFPLRKYFGVNFQFVFDHYGNFYFGLGPGLSQGVSVNLNNGYLLQGERSEGGLKSFITRHTVFIEGGVVLGGGAAWGDPSLVRGADVRDVAAEFGATSPGIGAGYVYGFLIYDSGISNPWFWQ